MMQLSSNAIKDFKTIYHTEYGMELSDAEAEEKARNLLALFQIIARTLPSEHAHTCLLHPKQSPTR
jgi:hypothetical protein